MTEVAATQIGKSPRPARRAWSDRLNPILVRELQQSASGRSFQVQLVLGCWALVFLAFWLGAGDPSDRPTGSEAFGIVMGILAPLGTLLAPLAAFQAARTEVRSGLAEQLSLTRMSARKIVRGKILAGLLIFLTFLSMFAPAVGATYLLRGIDLFSVFGGIIFVTLLSLLCNTFAVAMGIVGGSGRAQSLVMLLTVVGLVGATIFGAQLCTWLPDFFNRFGPGGGGDELYWTMAGVVGVVSFLTVMFGQLATSQLTHEYENRSTGFRILLAAGLLGVTPFALAFPDDRVAVGAVLTMTAVIAAVSAPVWVLGCCEGDSLTRVVRRTVPRTRWKAVLATPFLPGRRRALGQLALIAICHTALLWSFVQFLPSFFGRYGSGFGSGGAEWRGVGVLWSQVLFYGALATAARRAVGASTAPMSVAFSRLLLVLVGWNLFLVMIRVLGGGFEWTILDALNPVWTGFEAMRESSPAIVIVGIQGLFALVYALAELITGTREVLQVGSESSSPGTPAFAPAGPDPIADRPTEESDHGA